MPCLARRVPNSGARRRPPGFGGTVVRRLPSRGSSLDPLSLNRTPRDADHPQSLEAAAPRFGWPRTALWCVVLLALLAAGSVRAQDDDPAASLDTMGAALDRI